MKSQKDILVELQSRIETFYKKLMSAFEMDPKKIPLDEYLLVTSMVGAFFILCSMWKFATGAPHPREHELLIYKSNFDAKANKNNAH